MKADDDITPTLLKGLNIPPEPTLLVDLRKEIAKKYPEFKRISDIICKDVALSAAVLKTVNSAFYRIQYQVHSIQQAIGLLGLGAIVNTLKGLILYQSMAKCAELSLPRYWDSAQNVALICSGLAKRMTNIAPDEAYTLGLFCDCGIPIMAQKYPDYKEVLKAANDMTIEKFTQVEERYYNTNHAVVGYFVSKSWGLSEDIRKVILRHHYPVEIILDKESQSRSTFYEYYCILTLAAYIERLSRAEPESPVWKAQQSLILEYLGVSELDYLEIRDDMLEWVDNSGSLECYH
jgi:HD-like signal output (HDOD) protein